MKNLIHGLSVLLLGCSLISAKAQSSAQSYEEQVVRNTYAKLSFLCSLSPVAKSAIVQKQGLKLDDAALDLEISNAVPVFVLNNFRIGTVASIGNEIWGNIVTAPRPNREVLALQIASRGLTEATGNKVTWREGFAAWRPTPDLAWAKLSQVLAKSLREIVAIGSTEWTYPATYSRYAAFTVTATYRGKSTGSYKAVFFYGQDAAGKEVIAPQDFITDNQALYDVVDRSVYPDGFMHSLLRETPVAQSWIRSNQKSAKICSRAKRDVCCVAGRCGLSEADVQLDLSTPVPGSR